MEFPQIMTAKEIAAYLNISKSTALQIMRRPDFPVIRLSPRKIVVSSEKFLLWLDNAAEGKTSHIPQ